MKISEFSVENPVFINLLTVFIIVTGIISLLNLKHEAFPPVSFDVVTVTTYFRGAQANKVERLVTTPLEKELKDVSNIKEMVSVSNDGSSQIYLKMSSGVKNKQKVVYDIQKAVDRVNNLPDDVDERPIVTDITSEEIPVIKVSLSGDLPESELREFSDRLKDLFEDIPDVASVDRIGYRDEEYWVEPDPKKMEEFHISFKEISNALARQNVDQPGGKLKSEKEEFPVKVKAEFLNKQDIENTVIRANDLGNWVKVKDVASVRHSFEDDVVMNKVSATRAITLVVVKREGGDILNAVKRVRGIIKDFKKTTPSQLKISAFYDMSYYVNRRLNVLRSNGIIGFIFVVAILFMFLAPLPAVMTALGLPVAMLATLSIMLAEGFTINLITMFGLILVLGMLVDDGIIISENIYRYIEGGMPPQQAAVKGAEEVLRPVLATVLTTIAAFSPLMFMGGLLGRFIKYIPFVVITALLASLLESFIILPSHLAEFSHVKGDRRKHKDKRWFEFIRSKYEVLLNYSLRKRYFVIGVITLVFMLSLVAAKAFMPFILFSAKGVEQFSVRLEAEPGVSLKYTNSLIKPVEKLIASLPPKYLDAYETVVGRLKEDRGFDPNAKQGSNFAQINVYLTAYSKRDKTAGEIIKSLEPKLKGIYESLRNKGVKKLYAQEFKEGPPVGRAVDVRVRGENFKVLKEISNKVADYLRTVKGVVSISDNYNLGGEEVNVIIDREKASRVFLTDSDIAFAVRAAFAGVVSTTIKRSKAEKEIKVLVRFPQKFRGSFKVFDNIFIRNKFDNLISFKDVARIEMRPVLRSISHMNGKRFISVTADVDNKKITSLKVNSLLRKRFSGIRKEYPGYSINFSGENEETLESLHNLAKAFIIAFFLIFLILSTQFNSFIQPFIVMCTIPLGIIGVIIAFILHGEPLSFLAILGIVGLAGVVVNDSIVLVDFINKMRMKGLDRRESIQKAGSLRFRAVLLTTFTTVSGLWTVAYGIGGSDPFLKPMALAMSWGLLFATFFTLIVIPCLYAVFDDLSCVSKAWRRQ